MTQPRRGGRQGIGEGASTAMVNQRARQQVAHGVTAEGRDERIDAILDEVRRYSTISPFNAIRRWATLEKDILTNEMRRIQVDQYRGELVPAQMVLDIRNQTIQLIQDTLGESYIANLVNQGIDAEEAKRGYDDMMQGIRSLYAEYARQMRESGGT